METQTKPGWKTTEFWLTLLATTIGMLWASGIASPDGADAVSRVVGIIAATLSQLGYAVSRGMAKRQ
jgi:hypothetical protein